MGDSHDKALADTINGLCKAELIHRRAPWKTKASLELRGTRGDSLGSPLAANRDGGERPRN